MPKIKGEKELWGYEYALVKWNGGIGALLCNKCRTVIHSGLPNIDREYLCDDCQPRHRDGT